MRSERNQKINTVGYLLLTSVPAFPRAVAEDGIQPPTTKKNHTTKTKEKEKYKKREIELLPSIPLI
ncbi:hypothetical protein EGT49_11535 [Companilactobacillus suantsaicola]|uniref:Uncharacterized protein n=1 Tax=Companilactobacillus suantsaicola TaxID=2487723 RepID=A0A4Z0JEZ4_9LACO|nr:hypothetical protein [Companilactobacillus suantsaicola]TGD21239.1 hypothetical protein EGT49_11535 [Companilactobacillus suantsaicola]